MQQDWLGKRVEVLELAMEGLTGLPDAVGRLDRRVADLEQQVLQHRDETRSEFSSTRAEMRTLNEETRAEMRTLNEETRTEMRVLNEEVRAEMRMLHEEVLTRIKTLGEGAPPASTRRRRR
jgi:hypothetical protein